MFSVRESLLSGPQSASARPNLENGLIQESGTFL